MTSRRKCSGKVYSSKPGRVHGLHKCTRPGTVERDGQWWCWQHDPERVEVKAIIKRMTTWQSEQNRLDAMYIRNARLGPLVTEELAALLERLASALLASCVEQEYLDSEAARAHAARIREALALETIE